MSAKIGVVYISDRDPDLYLRDCIGSFNAHCQDPTGLLVAEHVVVDRAHQLGMSGAVNAAWRWGLNERLDYLMHVEEDFVFRHDFSLRAMVFAMTWARDACQMVLKRQPWSPEEQAHGNIVSMGYPVHQQNMHTDELGTVRWVTHQRLFSLNPCLLPFDTFRRSYPVGNEAEFTSCMRILDKEFAFFGGIDDPPLVEHVGHVRGDGWKL